MVKTSSLGDVLHTLPALSDARAAIPDWHCDWVVEEAFSEIPAWHPAVRQVIPLRLRQWRRRPLARQSREELGAFLQKLRQQSYDLVIDAQGLLKSALVTRFARGIRVGLDFRSAREPLAAWGYQRRIPVPRDRHAIERVRRLFAQAMGYPWPDTEPDYGIRQRLSAKSAPGHRLMFLHGTTWPSKHWPEPHWLALARLATAAGYGIDLPWGNAAELARAERLAQAISGCRVLPRLSLSALTTALEEVEGVVGVDTGLAHLAAALEVPGLCLYGPTSTALTGTRGRGQHQLQAALPCVPCLQHRCTHPSARDGYPACLAALDPDEIWTRLRILLAQGQAGGGGSR